MSDDPAPTPASASSANGQVKHELTAQQRRDRRNLMWGLGVVAGLVALAYVVVPLVETSNRDNPQADVVVEDGVPQESVPESTTLTAEERFVQLIRVNQPSLDDVPDESLVAGGESICDGLDEGRDVGRVFILSLNGMKEGGAGENASTWAATVTSAAVYELCPAYIAEMEEVFGDKNPIS